MKKLFAMVLAVAAISFASCGNKTEKEGCDQDTCACKCDPCECDPCECAEKECCGECPMKVLDEKLEAGDAEGVTAALTKVQEKIQELLAEGKAEEAQKLGSAIKAFIEANQEKLSEASINVDNICSVIKSLPEVAVETAEDGAEAVKTDAEAVANAAVEAGKAKANEKLNEGAAKANEAIDEAANKANDAIDKAAAKASKKLGL